jgi:hypothetical protein
MKESITQFIARTLVNDEKGKEKLASIIHNELKNKFGDQMDNLKPVLEVLDGRLIVKWETLKGE